MLKIIRENLLFFTLLEIIINLFWSRSCLVSCMKAPQVRFSNRDASLHDSVKLHSVAPFSNQSSQGVAQTSVPNTESNKVIVSPITDNAPKETHTRLAGDPSRDPRTVTLPIVKKTDERAPNSTHKDQENVIPPSKSGNAKMDEHDQEKEMESIEKLTKLEKHLVKRTEKISGKNIVFAANEVPSECLEKMNCKSFILEEIFSEEKLKNLSEILERAICEALTVQREITLEEFDLCIKDVVSQFRYLKDFGDLMTYFVDETKSKYTPLKKMPELNYYYAFPNINNKNKGMALIRLRSAFENYKGELVLKAKIFVEAGFPKRLKKLYMERKDNGALKNPNAPLKGAGSFRNTTSEPYVVTIKGNPFLSDLHSTKGHIGATEKGPVEIERDSRVRRNMAALTENTQIQSKNMTYVSCPNEKANSEVANDRSLSLPQKQARTDGLPTQKRDTDLAEQEEGISSIQTTNGHGVTPGGPYHKTNSRKSVACNTDFIFDEKKSLYPVLFFNSVPSTTNNPLHVDLQSYLAYDPHNPLGMIASASTPNTGTNASGYLQKITFVAAMVSTIVSIMDILFEYFLNK